MNQGIHVLLDPPNINKYIFVSIPRTGSTSVSHVLGIPNNHISAKEFQQRDPDFENKFKFTIVRNPYHRFLSAFYFSGELLQLNITPNEYLSKYDLAEEVSNENGYARLFLRPQHSWIYEEKKSLVNYIAHTETLHSDWENISKEVGIFKPLPHMRECRYKQVPLTSKSRRILHKFYEMDFLLFGY